MSNKRKCSVSVVLAAVLIAAPFVSAVCAQNGDGTAPPVDPAIARDKALAELRKAQAEAAKAEADAAKAAADAAKAAADARKAELDALKPSSSATPLPGTTTADDKHQMEAETLAHEALGEVAVGMGNAIIAELREQSGGGPTKPVTIVVHNDRIVGDVLFFDSFLAQKAVLSDSYTAALKEPEAFLSAGAELAPLASIGLAAPIVGSIVDALAFFRQNTTLSGRVFTIEEAVIVSRVAREIRDHNRRRPQNSSPITVKYPALYSRAITDPSKAGELVTVKALKELTELRARADRILTAHADALARVAKAEKQITELPKEIAELEKQLKALPKGDPKRPAIEASLATKRNALQQAAVDKPKYEARAKGLDPNDNVARLKALNSQLDAFTASLIKPDDKGAGPALATVIRGEIMRNLVADKDAYVLYLKSVSAGGTVRTHQNLWRTMFSGPAIDYSGAAIANYILFDKNGNILISKPLYAHTGYRKFRSTKKEAPLTNVTAGSPEGTVPASQGAVVHASNGGQ